jgi:hypothetical protein
MSSYHVVYDFGLFPTTPHNTKRKLYQNQLKVSLTKKNQSKIQIINMKILSSMKGKTKKEENQK